LLWLDAPTNTLGRRRDVQSWRGGLVHVPRTRCCACVPAGRCRMKFQCCRLAMQTGISFSHADNSLVDRLCRTTRLAVAVRPHAYQQRRISLPRRAGRRVPVRCPLRGSSDVRPGRRSTAPLNCISPALHASVTLRAPLTVHPCQREGDSVAEWLACRTQAQ